MLASLAGLLIGLTPQGGSIPADWPVTAEGKRVIVVWNRAVPEGEELAKYYAWKRGVPKTQVVMISVIGAETMNSDEFEAKIIRELQPRTQKLPGVDFIVLAKGMPLRIFDLVIRQHYSLDSYISTMDMDLKPMVNPSSAEVQRIASPYFNKDEPFSRKKYGFFLVTRLDGYTFADARRMVDNSINARGDKGPFHLDAMPNFNANDGYGAMNASLAEAARVLGDRGFQVNFDKTADFARVPGPVMGYASWGSNDHKYVKDHYVGVRFKPGAIAETFVSTSGRTMKPVTEGQSVITDLIKNGVTGVKGYVNEPYTLALARPNILFDRYTRGYNLAESFAMASPLLKWRDIVFGDPLCRPYKK